MKNKQYTAQDDFLVQNAINCMGRFIQPAPNTAQGDGHSSGTYQSKIWKAPASAHLQRPTNRSREFILALSEFSADAETIKKERPEACQESMQSRPAYQA